MPRLFREFAAAAIAATIGYKVSGGLDDLQLYIATVSGIYWVLLK